MRKWIFYIVQLSGFLFSLYLLIRERGKTPRAPVNDVLPTVDQTFVVQVHEYLNHLF